MYLRTAGQRMELRHLRYFVVLAEELHFGRAATRLCITQPPLSFNIKQLEDELGVILLDRGNKRVVLTQAGKAFYDEACVILASADRAKEIAIAISRGQVGRLDIGFSGSMIYRDLPAVTQRYRTDWPLVDLMLHESALSAQIAALERGKLDAGFVDLAGVPEGLTGLKLCEEPYMACVADTHRLAGNATIELAELADEAFVSFDRQGAPVNFDRVTAMCLAAGFTPKVRHAVKQWITIVGLVSYNFGVALVPERMRQIGMIGIKFIPLAGSHGASSTGYLLWNPERSSERLEHFVEVARTIISGRS